MFNYYNWQDSTPKLFITSFYFWSSPTVVLFLKISPVWIYPTSGRTHIWTINLHFQQRFFFFPLFSLCFGQGVTTRPKIGLKWCARGALLIFLVIFTKAIHILMLYLGFWHATIKRIHNFWYQKISLDLKKLDLKNLMRSQKILWDLKKMLWISKK